MLCGSRQRFKKQANKQRIRIECPDKKKRAKVARDDKQLWTGDGCSNRRSWNQGWIQPKYGRTY
jgi:ribosomal protein L37AE/L43A